MRLLNKFPLFSTLLINWIPVNQTFGKWVGREALTPIQDSHRLTLSTVVIVMLLNQVSFAACLKWLLEAIGMI